jgi:tetratricopeptide (TPR) repeat protein
MQVFLLLADAEGQVVTRNRLYDECWGGLDVGDYSLNRAITMVRRIAAEADPGAFIIESIPRTGYRLLVEGDARAPAASPEGSRARSLALIGALILVAALAGFVSTGMGGKDPNPAIVIASTDSRSAELVRGIANMAAEKAAEYDADFRLLEDSETSRRRADFILRARDLSLGNRRKVELSLVANRDKSILWNWTAEQPESTAASMEHAAQSTGAMVLTCAAETRAGGRGRAPDQQTVKLYLDACSKFENWAGAQLMLITDAFEEVTARAPQLRGAWQKLFISKAEAIEGKPHIDLTESLKRDIANSLAQGIDIPETYGARAALLPFNARYERLKLNEEGLARYPRHIGLLMGRSWLLRQVGRMDEAANTARRAAQIYPQSSAASTEYANSLMQSGRLDSARNVIERAEKLSPDAPNIRGARWRLELRYGDPRVALGMAHSGTSVVDPAMISFLEARANPTKENIDRALVRLRAQYREESDPGLLVQALGGFGRAEEAIQILIHFDGSNSGDASEDLFRPSLREVRRDPRFIQIARNFGVTDYWLKTGILPDFCYEPDLPYDCRRELSKLAR